LEFSAASWPYCDFKDFTGSKGSNVYEAFADRNHNTDDNSRIARDLGCYLTQLFETLMFFTQLLMVSCESTLFPAAAERLEKVSRTAQHRLIRHRVNIASIVSDNVRSLAGSFDLDETADIPQCLSLSCAAYAMQCSHGQFGIVPFVKKLARI
jgi:hypothetical protein